MRQVDRLTPTVWKGAVAGIAAGLVASLAMDRFQALVTALSSDEEEGEPATEKAADRVWVATTGAPVPEADRPLAGQAVHYALGTALGLAYGAAAEVSPAVAAGGGAAFGLAVAGVLDEATVPAVGLGEVPWRTPGATHVYTAVSHLVFGVTAEVTRRFVRGMLG